MSASTHVSLIRSGPSVSTATIDLSRAVQRQPVSQRTLILRAFRRHTLATVGLAIILILIVVAVLAPGHR
jgi:hypothetical protein